jgi:hypothetical protein
MTALPQLVLHIGAGKAGSTSIQFALKRNAQALAAHDTAYVGLMLERVPGATAHDWCVEGQPSRYFRQPPQERPRVEGEAFETIHAELQRLGALGFTQVVWSNEAFLPFHNRIVRVIRRLAEAGVPVRIVCYLRRHDRWARSAYVQFGLKGKMHPGPIRGFRDWVAANPVAFADQVETWQRSFPGLVELYNFDALDDAVPHFCGLIGVEGIPSMRANEAPTNPMLAAYVVHNSEYDAPAPPEIMAVLTAPMRLQTERQSKVPPLEDLLPTTEDLVALQAECAPDLARLNALLAEQGQPPLVFDAPKPFARSTTGWEMDRLMLQMILALQRQVNDLRAEIAALRGG